jgi:hypothetical protein
VFENSVLRRIFEQKRDEVRRWCKKLDNEMLRNLYSSLSMFKIIKLWKMDGRIM